MIVELMMRRLREHMGSEHGVAIELTARANDLLADKGYDPAMGARPLRRTIQQLIEDPLADFVLGRTLAEGSTIVIDHKEGEDDVELTVVAPVPDTAPEPPAGVAGDSVSDES